MKKKSTPKCNVSSLKKKPHGAHFRLYIVMHIGNVSFFWD